MYPLSGVSVLGEKDRKFGLLQIAHLVEISMVASTAAATARGTMVTPIEVLQEIWVAEGEEGHRMHGLLIREMTLEERATTEEVAVDIKGTATTVIT